MQTPTQTQMVKYILVQCNESVCTKYLVSFTKNMNCNDMGIIYNAIAKVYML